MKKKTPDRHIQSVFSRKMLLVLHLLFFVSLAHAATEDSTRVVTFSTKAESLNNVLIKFKDQTGVEILFNRQLLGDQKCKELFLLMWLSGRFWKERDSSSRKWMACMLLKKVRKVALLAWSRV